MYEKEGEGMGNIREEISERFDLPALAMGGLPRITLSGDRQVLVENHRGILEYGGELVEVAGGRVRVRIRGRGLYLRAMDPEMILVAGEIFGVDLE